MYTFFNQLQCLCSQCFCSSSCVISVCPGPLHHKKKKNCSVYANYIVWQAVLQIPTASKNVFVLLPWIVWSCPALQFTSTLWKFVLMPCCPISACVPGSMAPHLSLKNVLLCREQPVLKKKVFKINFQIAVCLETYQLLWRPHMKGICIKLCETCWRSQGT